MAEDLQMFAVCLPGLEHLLLRELTDLAVSEPDVDAGGVSFRGSRRDLYRANLELGLASQVLVRVGDFGARSLGEVVRKTARLPWQDLLSTTTPVRVKASCRKSRLYHSGAVEERVLEGISEALGAEAGLPTAAGDGEGGALLVRARMLQDHLTLSLDTSGEPLHRRGWRLHVGKAPLREDLARALVMASGWDRRSTLFDPMMGSGAIVIEAACMARRLAPGRLRGFAFQSMQGFDEDLWSEVLEQANQAALPHLSFRIIGSDRDPRSLASATSNAERAGVAKDLDLAQRPLMDVPGLDTSGDGAIVTNPPYGHRLGNVDSLRTLYQSLGNIVRELPERWHFALLAMDRRLALRTGLPLKTAFLADNGGLKVRALLRDGSAA